LKEVRYLLNNQNEITFEELYELLKDNQLKNFDPVKDAFKVYDPNDSGFVDMAVVHEFFDSLGFGTISDEVFLKWVEAKTPPTNNRLKSIRLQELKIHISCFS
jgi:Ca2+-binding EF-hand superfamily protein